MDTALCFISVQEAIGDRTGFSGIAGHGSKRIFLLVDGARQVGKTFRDYEDEFEWLISAGIALSVQAISNPVCTDPEVFADLMMPNVEKYVCILQG